MSRAGAAGLYIDAARRIRPSQLAGRLRRLVPPRALALGLGTHGPGEFAPVAGGLLVEAAPQSGPGDPPDETGVFSAVGVRRRADAPTLFTDGSDGLLFLFHLNGFAPLAAYAAGPRSSRGDSFWAGVLERWLASEARPRMPSWHPFPTSMRIAAWAAALSSGERWPERLRSALVRSLWVQVRYLARAVEHDIGGNHVLKNATALVIAGACFPRSGVAPAGLRLLERQVERQMLADGCHEERSTSYHREVTHDLRTLEELLERSSAAAPAWLQKAAARAAAWQEGIAGPDLRLPLLNDAWEGPPLARRTHADREPGESGYTVIRHGGDQLVFDVGMLSPDHLPPHAHADALSIVLWVDGRPLLVDPGSFSYSGPMRDPFRATAAHNTVEIDGQSQCEFWGDFRVAHPPRVRAGITRRIGGTVVASGAHDGYRRLARPVEHCRALVWLPGEGLIIIDLLRGRGSHVVRSPLHLHPSVPRPTVRTVGPFAVTALGPRPNPSVHPTSYSPYLGVRQPSWMLEDRRTIEPESPFGWSLLRGDREVVALDRERVTLAGGNAPPTTVPLEWP